MQSNKIPKIIVKIVTKIQNDNPMKSVYFLSIFTFIPIELYISNVKFTNGLKKNNINAYLQNLNVFNICFNSFHGNLFSSIFFTGVISSLVSKFSISVFVVIGMFSIFSFIFSIRRKNK